MLRLPKGTLRAGCNFATAMVLFNLISGASVCFLDASLEDLRKKSERGKRFKDLLNGYYPWHQEVVSPERAISILWQYARNPLAHTFGFHHPDEGLQIGLMKSKLTDKKVRQVEEAAERPEWLPPTFLKVKQTSNGGTKLRVSSADLYISVPTLYWGTHRMLHSLFADRHQAERADALAVRLMEDA